MIETQKKEHRNGVSATDSSGRHVVSLETTNLHIKAFIPVGVQGLFDDTGSVCLLRIDSDDGERVRKPEDITFRETIRSDD